MKMKRLVPAIVLFTAACSAGASARNSPVQHRIPGLITATLVFNAADANKGRHRDLRRARSRRREVSVCERGLGERGIRHARSAAARVERRAADAVAGGEMLAPAGAATAADARAGHRAGDDGRPAVSRAGEARPSAQGARARARGRLRSFVDSAGRENDRGARHEDGRVGRRRSRTTWPTSLRKTSSKYDAVFLASTTGAPFSTIPNERAPRPRRGVRRCWTSSAAARASRGSTRRRICYHARTRRASRRRRARGTRRSTAAQESSFANLAPGATLADTMIAQHQQRSANSTRRGAAKALADAWFDATRCEEDGPVGSGRFRVRRAARAESTGRLRPAGPRHADGLVAGLQSVDRRLLQVPLGRSAVDHREDRRSEEPADGDVPRQEFDIRDEIYTMGIKSFSRDNVHVLTSIDYGKMSAEDKALESNPRADHDYGLSWIHREGQGCVFYEAAWGTASASTRTSRS